MSKIISKAETIKNPYNRLSQQKITISFENKNDIFGFILSEYIGCCDIKIISNFIQYVYGDKLPLDDLKYFVLKTILEYDASKFSICLATIALSSQTTTKDILEYIGFKSLVDYKTRYSGTTMISTMIAYYADLKKSFDDMNKK